MIRPKQIALIAVLATAAMSAAADTNVVLRAVGAGTFAMGANVLSGASYESQELPVHDVTLSRGYLVGETEITIAQYCAFLNNRAAWLRVSLAADDGTSNACYAVIESVGDGSPLVWLPVRGPAITNTAGNWQPVAATHTNHPIVNVSWYGAALYCNFLSEIQGLVSMYSSNDWSCGWSVIGSTNSGYHLPSEAQWEHAARGWQRDDAFPWGRFMDYGRCNIYKRTEALGYTNPASWPCTLPVRSFEANSIGLYDVIGNVAEWCDDWYDPGYYGNGDRADPTDAMPCAPLLGATNKVVRGGGWGHSPLRLPSLSARGHWHATTGAKDVGFRVVREWSGETNAAPTAPLNLVAVTNTLGALALAWMPPLSANHDGYVLQVSGVSTAIFAAADVAWSVPDVASGRWYVFDLYATNHYGWSPSNHYEVTAYSSEPTTPRDLHVTMNTPTNVTLAWQAPASANQEGCRITRDAVWQTDLASAATTWADESVAAESSYAYRVFATNQLGTSPGALINVTVPNHLCELAVSPASLNFGNVDIGRTLEIGNDGVGNLYWANTIQYVNGTEWLSVAPLSGAGDGTATVSVSRASLAPGSYTGRVVITSNGGSATVDVVVLAVPILIVAPTTRDFGYRDETLHVTVTNPGCPGLSWSNVTSTVDGSNWLTALPSSGTGDGTVSVSVDRAAVDFGTVTGSVLFSSSYGAATVTVTMSRAQLDWWVDSAAAPGGDGRLPGTPLRTIQPALAGAAEGIGVTVHIHGGAGRLYTNNAYVVDKANLTLTDWEAKPTFRLDGVADNINDRVVEIATNSVTLRNLRFEIDSDVIGGGDSVVEFTGGVGGENNITIDGCEFVMIDGFGGAWNQGSPLDMGNVSATNKVIRNCLFQDWDRGDGYRINMIDAAGQYCTVVGNVFSNFSRGMGGDMRYSVIANNRFWNSVNENDLYAIIGADYHGLRDCEISHNIAWNDNDKRTTFLRKTRDGLSNARIFNNTVYRVRNFVNCEYYAEDGTLWDDALVVNNLMLSSIQTNIVGDADGTGTNMIRVVTEISHNMWYGGSAGLSDDVPAGILSNNYHVNGVILNTTDPNDPDFMRPDAVVTPQILRGYGGSYASYIGAVPPQLPRPTGSLYITW